MLHPNRLEGREGKLLQVLQGLEGYSRFEGEHNPDDTTYRTKGWTGQVEIPRGAVVMFCGVGQDPNGFGWIDVLHGEKKLRVFINVIQWMIYFIPWPRGGFVD